MKPRQRVLSDFGRDMPRISRGRWLQAKPDQTFELLLVGDYNGTTSSASGVEEISADGVGMALALTSHSPQGVIAEP
jgi:hypothetical protein